MSWQETWYSRTLRLPGNGDLAETQVLTSRAIPVIKLDVVAAANQQSECFYAYQEALEKTGRPIFGVFIRIGNAHFGKRDYMAASAAYRQATSVSPNDVRGHFNLGEALFQLKDFTGAEAAYRKAIELGKPDAKAHEFLGSSLFQQKRIDEAIQQYRIAIAISGTKNPDAHYNLGVALLARNEHGAAEKEFRLAIAQRLKELPEDHFNLALALQEQGRIGEAITAYEYYLRLAPNAPDAERIRTIVQHLKQQKK
jgi:tetratricopeptide (TPR) repeat protein